VLLYLLAALMVLDLWGFDFSAFMTSKLGKLIFEKAFSIFTIIAVTLFLYRAGLGLLDKYLSAEQDAQNESQKQKMARFKTIHTVSRNILRIAIWAPAVLLILVEMDLPIMPILAPFTVIGIGLSLGIQSLVKDFVTGFSMLMEDAFAVGDLVVINGQMGRIESLSVRVVRLRATDGALYVFPYGSIGTFCNQNRDYSAVVILFQVGIEADIPQLYEILDQISKDLRKDPKVRPMLAGSIEIDGVNEISDHALQVRAVLKTKPGKHFKVKWAFNLLLKQHLEAAQIPSATPRQVTHNYAIEK
jgi:small-conductance mechanosensitive channel